MVGLGSRAVSVDLTGRFPMLRIPAEHEKGNQDRLMPIAPEFAEVLLSVPDAERVGRVFKLARCRGCGAMTPMHVSRTVTKIGRVVGVKVHTEASRKRPGKGRGGDGAAKVDAGPRVKYASAHDLRRAFGARWALRVMPPVLQQLMRHESIETTMRYYVGRSAETTAEALYAAMGTGQNGPAANPNPLPGWVSTLPATPAPNRLPRPSLRTTASLRPSRVPTPRGRSSIG